MKLGFLGGTFNPIHFGHLRAAEEVRERLALDKVLFIPSGTPPLKSDELAGVEARLSMARLAVSGNRHFEASDAECRRPEKSYSVDTVRELKKAYPGDETYFILGIDAFLDLPNWHSPESFAGLTDFAVMNRPPFSFRDIGASPFLTGGPVVGPEKGGVKKIGLTSGRAAFLVGITPLFISSTDVRAMVREKKSVKYLLPEAVESFIISHGLYAG